MRRITQWLCLGGLLLLIPLIVFASALNQTREAFLAALADLAHGKQQQFLMIAEHLRDYPLYPYLVYADVVMHLNQASPATIENFLFTYRDTPLAGHLRNLWLTHLAQQQNWPQFIQFYRPVDDMNLQCAYRAALWHTGNLNAATQGFVALLGKSARPPANCLWVLSAALHQGKLGEDLLWQRIDLAFAQKDVFAAKQFASFLTPHNKKLFVIWLRLYQQPLFMLRPGLWQVTGNQTAYLLHTALQRLADKNVTLAVQVWQHLQQQYHFSFDSQQQAVRTLGLALAEAHLPSANEWLSFVAPAYADQTVKEWRIRSALYTQQWPEVLRAIYLLPAKMQQQSAWRYWRARALAAEGQISAARIIYRNLALQGDLYGQFASLQLGQAPLFALKQLTVNRSQIEALAMLPAMQRAYELYQLGWLDEAHQEWEWALNHLPQADYLAAAELAVQWGWYNQAIATVNHINDIADMHLRYPVAYRESVLENAGRQQLNPAWMFALIRQESLFAPQVRSSAGALGLMQVLPDTGALIARQLHLAFAPQELLDANFNVLLGSIYLRRMLNHFHGNILLATAAYNAGPGRVVQWIPVKPLPADIWIETIPWHQTRQYVKNITASTTFYEKELGLPSTLAQRLQPI